MTFIAWVAILSIAGCLGSHAPIQMLCSLFGCRCREQLGFQERPGVPCQDHGRPHTPTVCSVETCSRLPQAVPSLSDPLPALLLFFGALCCMSGQSFLVQRDEQTCQDRLLMMEEVLRLDGLPSTKYRRICDLVDGYEWDDSDVNLLQKIDIPITGNIHVPPHASCVGIDKEAGGNVGSTANQKANKTHGSASQTSQPSQPTQSALSVQQLAVIEANRIKSIELRDAKRLEKEQRVKQKETEVFEGMQWL